MRQLKNTSQVTHEPYRDDFSSVGVKDGIPCSWIKRSWATRYFELALCSASQSYQINDEWLSEVSRQCILIEYEGGKWIPGSLCVTIGSSYRH